MSRAEKFEDEKRRLIRSCFSKRDPDGSIHESYITHIRITEDAAYPTTPAPPNSPQSNKKPRLIIVAVKKSGRVRIHKARENSDETFSIGKTWNMDELASIQIFEHLPVTTATEQNQQLWASNIGFVVTITKPYYWQAQTPKERDFFIGSLVKIFKKYTGGKVPDLIGFTQADKEAISGVMPVGQQQRQPSSRSRTPQGRSRQVSQQQQQQQQPMLQQQPVQQPVSPGAPLVSMSRPSRDNLRKTSRDQLHQPTSNAPIPPSPSYSRYRAYSPKGSASSGDGTMPNPKSPSAPASPYTIGRPSTSGSTATDNNVGANVQSKMTAPMQIPGTNSSRPSLDIPSPTDRARPSNIPFGSSPLSRPPGRSRSPSPAPPSSPLALRSSVSPNSQQENVPRSRKASAVASGPTDQTIAPPDLKTSERKTSPAPSNRTLQTPATDSRRPSHTPSVLSGTQNSPKHTPADVSAKATTSPSASAVPSPPNEPVKPIEEEPTPDPTAHIQPSEKGKTITETLESVTGPAATMATAAAAAGAVAGAGGAPTDVKEATIKAYDATAPVADTAEAGVSSETAGENIVESVAAAAEEHNVHDDEKATDDEFRPGLGPMFKPKIGSTQHKVDVANALKKASNAYAAFRPRAGGAGERLLAAAVAEKEREKAAAAAAASGSTVSGGTSPTTVPGEGDGITGVLRAPILRSLSTDTAGSMPTPHSTTAEATTPQPASIKEKAPPALTPLATSDEALGKDANKAILEPVTPAIEVSQAPDDSKFIEQAMEDAASAPKTQAERLRQKRQDELAECCSAIGVDPTLLSSRGVEFDDILTSIGWTGRLAEDKRIEDLEADVRREIGRVQAGSWLGHLELQQEGKVDQLAQLFDKTIAECDELEGLLTLYSHELNTLADDVAHIEAQSQGLQVQAANQKLLQNELQNLLQMISISPEELAPLQDGTINTIDGLKATEGALSTLYKAMVTIDPEIRSNQKRMAENNTNVGGTLAVYADAEIGQMRAVKEKKGKYRNDAHKFLLRLKTTMDLSFRTANKKTVDSRGRQPVRTSMEFTTTNSGAHDTARQELWMYNGLMLFAREVNTAAWLSIIQLYQEQIRPLYQVEVSDNVEIWKRGARKPTEQERDQLSFSHSQQEKEPTSAVDAGGMGLTEAIFDETNQEFILHTLQKINERYKHQFHTFIDEQIRAIEETKVKVSKRKGVIPFMRTFPLFSTAVENILSLSQETHDVRHLVNEAYSRINKAMWDTLKFIAKEAPGQAPSGPGVQTTADFEEKEILNYHILLIENMNHFLEEVDPGENTVLYEWRRRANNDMIEHLRLYTDAVVRRPIGKLLDFIESTESLMQTITPHQEIATRPSHSRHMAKKVMFYLDSKEIRRGIEVLKKRVEKHFGDEDQTLSRDLVGKVLKECEAAYMKAHDRISYINEAVYDNSIEIAWTKEDAITMFAK
ncbi:Exocyst complex, component Exoc1 [Ascosphaera apis ARSEF 7405]|uniref:Exocyst complex, component Exoc1 n=1 Tax=Ascosphaera apis ARSEF 7405 TaxID=392613 RepID=A0A166PMH1_9EURO|nr:Exocyst complex, component Exoc1 [Ascosphaera apis ARSEF 7405]